MSAFTKKVRVGRYGMPMWSAALAVVVAVGGIAAAAGQALGPVLAGGAGGNVGVVASQNIFYKDVVATKGHSGDIDQAVANIDTSGLILQGAFRMHRGDSPSTLDITLENRGDNTKSATIKVTRPAGTSVDLSNTSTCGLAQSAVMVSGGTEVDTYLLTTPPAPADCVVTAYVTVGTAEPLGSFNVNMVLEEIP